MVIESLLQKMVERAANTFDVGFRYLGSRQNSAKFMVHFESVTTFSFDTLQYKKIKRFLS